MGKNSPPSFKELHQISGSFVQVWTVLSDFWPLSPFLCTSVGFRTYLCSETLKTLYLFIFLYFKRISRSIRNPTLCAPFTFTLDQSKATIKKIPEKILPALFYKNTWCEDLQAQSTAEPTSLSWLIHRQHPDRKKSHRLHVIIAGAMQYTTYHFEQYWGKCTTNYF